MNQDTAYGVVKTLESLRFIGNTCILGYMVGRVKNNKQAIWVIFKQCAYPWENFQYTPSGNWEELDNESNIVGQKDW